MKLRRLIASSVIFGVAALVAGVVGLVTTGQPAIWAVNVGWMLGGLVGFSGALAAALHVERSRVGWAWRLWTAATGLWFVAAIFASVCTALGASVGLYVEALWTPAAVLAIAGLAMRSAPGWLAFRLFLLDALPVALLVAAGVAALAGGSNDSALSALLLVSLVIHALLPLISTQIVVWLASRATNMYLICVGFSLAAVTGLVWPIHARNSSEISGHWPSVFLTIGLLVIAAAGFRRAVQPRSYTVLRPLEREHAVRSVPGAVAVLILIVAAGTAGGHFLWLALAAAAAFALRSYLVRRTSVESEKILANLAQLDPLTELLNRRGLQDALSRELDRSERDSGPLVALLIDLDDFKLVNLRLGYGVADNVLREVARVLRSSGRSTDHAARIGGDEFLVLLPGSSPDEGVRVAERIRRGISDLVFSSISEEVHVTASVGVVHVPPRSVSLDDLVALADTVLRKSKQAGKDRSSVAGTDGSSAVTSLVDELCSGGRLRAVGQPIVRLADGQVCGYELLSRSTIEGYELPGDFFPLCHGSGRLSAIDYECFCTCVDAIDWLDESLRYHVNLFPATLLDASVDRIAGVLPDDRARRACCIELSEQQIGGDGSHLLEPVRALKEAGFLIAVDDVGFGRSSLESLLLLEPDIVKIDRAFVHGIGTVGDLGKRRALMRLLDVARVLGADVVAEGIETERDLAVLRGSAPPSVRDMRLAARPSSPPRPTWPARGISPTSRWEDRRSVLLELWLGSRRRRR